jgi:hypothetical protein
MLAIPSPRSAAHIALVKMVVASSWSNVEWTTVLNVPAVEFCDPPCWRHAYTPAVAIHPIVDWSLLCRCTSLRIASHGSTSISSVIVYPFTVAGARLTNDRSHQLRWRHRKHCGYPFESELPSREMDAFSATLTSIRGATRFLAPFQTARLGRGFRTARTTRKGQVQTERDSDPAT